MVAPGYPGTPRGALAGHGDADLSHRQQAAKNLPWKATGGHIGPPGPVSLAGDYKPHRHMPAVFSLPRLKDHRLNPTAHPRSKTNTNPPTDTRPWNPWPL